MEEVLQNFEKAWQKFETSFKGKLLAKSKKQSLSLSVANLILKEASGEWFSGYGTEGKWLSDYKRDCPDRAEAVTTILKHELKLGSGDEAEQKGALKETENSAPPSTMKLIVPVAGAVIGAGIGGLLGPFGAMVGAGGGAALAHNFTKGKGVLTDGKTQGHPSSKGGMDAYIAQLQAHKKRIMAVIQKPH